MSTPNDGGPAMPGFESTDGYGACRPFIMPSGEVVWQSYRQGMTLRQWYKGQAMIGHIVRAPWGQLPSENVMVALCAQAADTFIAEDAAFAEREKGEK